MNLKLLQLICCVSLCCFLASCGGSSSSTTSSLTEAETNILSGVVKAPASVVSETSASIMLAEVSGTVVSGVDVPFLGAKVCAHNGITNAVYTQKDYSTHLCTTTNDKGEYSLDYSHLLDVSVVTVIARKGVVEVLGVFDSTKGTDNVLNIDRDTTRQSLSLQGVLAKMGAHNLDGLTGSADISGIKSLIKEVLVDILNEERKSVSLTHATFINPGSTESEKREYRSSRASISDSIFSSERQAQANKYIDDVYSASSNFKEGYQFEFGSRTGIHSGSVYMPSKLPEDLIVVVGAGASIENVRQWSDGTTFDHGADCGDIIGTVKNIRVGDCHNFDASNAEGSFRAIDGFTHWDEAADHKELFKMAEMMAVGQAFLSAMDGGCIDSETYDKSFESVEFGESDKEYMSVFCTTGENAVKLDRTDFEAALTDLNQFMQYGYDASYVDTRDCGAHFDEYGHLRDSAPQYCYEEFGYDLENHSFFDPVRECWDEKGLNKSSYSTTRAQTECPYVLRDFREFTKHVMGAEATTLQVSNENHLMFICGWYGMWDEATQKDSLHPSAPQGCAVYSQVNMEEFNPLEECWMQDGTAKAVDTLVGFAKHDCGYFQEDVKNMTGSTTLTALVFPSLDPWLKRDLCDNYMEIQISNDGTETFSWREKEVPPLCKAVDITEGFNDHMEWEEHEEWSIITECYDGVNVKEKQDCGYLPKKLDLTNTIVLKDICDRFFNWNHNNPGFQSNAPAGCSKLLDYFSCRVKGDIYNESYWTAMNDSTVDLSTVDYFKDTVTSECKSVETLSKCLDFVWVDECDGTYMFDHNISATCDPIYNATSIDVYVPQSWNTMYCHQEENASFTGEPSYPDYTQYNYISIEDSYVDPDSCSSYMRPCDSTDNAECYSEATSSCNQDSSCHSFSIRKDPKGYPDDYIIYTDHYCVEAVNQHRYWDLHIKDNCNGNPIDECGICSGPGKRLWYPDTNNDGMGDSDDGIESCFRPIGYVHSYITPKPEVYYDCNGVANGRAVDDACGICNGPGKSTWYEDSDNNGKGNPAVSMKSCQKPAGYVSNKNDTFMVDKYKKFEDHFVKWDMCKQSQFYCGTDSFEDCYSKAEGICSDHSNCVAFTVRKAPGQSSNNDDYLIYTEKECVNVNTYKDEHWNLYVKNNCDRQDLDACGVCHGDGSSCSPFSYLGEGECRQSDGYYPAKFSISYHDLSPHTDGSNADNAKLRCKSKCDEYSWCLAAEVVTREVWKTPECRLVTDKARFIAAGMEFENDSWGGIQTIDGADYQTYCSAGSDSCTTRSIGDVVKLYQRDGYHCYPKKEMNF